MDIKKPLANLKRYAAIGALVAVPLVALAADTQRKGEARKSIQGAWRLVLARPAEGVDLAEPPNDWLFLRYITDTHFIRMICHPASKRIVSVACGSCIIHDNSYEESADYYASDTDMALLGKKIHFTYDIQNNKLHMTGVLPDGSKAEELYERCEKQGEIGGK